MHARAKERLAVLIVLVVLFGFAFRAATWLDANTADDLKPANKGDVRAVVEELRTEIRQLRLCPCSGQEDD